MKLLLFDFVVFTVVAAVVLFVDIAVGFSLLMGIFTNFLEQLHCESFLHQFMYLGLAALSWSVMNLPLVATEAPLNLDI